MALTAGGIAMSISGDRPLVDAVVVLGVGLIAPLALGRHTWWAAASVAAAIGLRLDEGVAASLFVVPAAVVSARAVFASALEVLAHGPSLRETVRLPSLEQVAGFLASVWALVAMISLMASTAGAELFGIGEPIVRLTAVHYLYAGVGALVVARRLHNETGRCRRLATSGVVATAMAPPVVAAGFVLNEALPQIGGAVLMTIGVWSSAAVLLVRAVSSRSAPNRLLRIVAGLTPWAPMVLAVSWATAQHVRDVPALSVPDMARLHGLANGLGFVLLGLLATSPSRWTATAPVGADARS